ncbi:MAG: amidohydrolase family protein [Planctomycetota bacterium]|jgi:imidazolonepropionase-like amidohydrolase
MLLTSTLLLTAMAAAPAQQGAVILQPDAIVAPDGSRQTGVSVVIRDGRIVEVAATPKTAGTKVQLSGVLAPGMIDAFSGRGADRLLTEQSARTTEDLRAADGLQMSSPVWESLMARGVTAVHVVPDPTNVLAGWGALVSTGGEDRVRQPQSAMVASLVQSSVTDTRVGPSSLAGAMEILEQALANPDGGDFGSRLWFFLENAEGARSAMAMTERMSGTTANPVLMGEVGSFGGLFAGQLVGLPTMGYGALARRAETWRLLHKAGTRFAFGSRAGNLEWDALRTSAMALSRFTGDVEAAWSSVSSNPAEMLGVGGEMGSIQVGARADLVLWTAHPLDATARVISVMIGGDTVYRVSQENM